MLILSLDGAGCVSWKWGDGAREGGVGRRCVGGGTGVGVVDGVVWLVIEGPGLGRL